MKLTAVSLLAALFLFSTENMGEQFGLHAPAMLTHANVFHLALNCWALWKVWRRPAWLIIPAIALGQLGMLADSQAVGASSMIFALVALQWRIYDCKFNRWFMAASLALSAALPQVSFWAHAVPFAAGIAVWLAAEKTGISWNRRF